LSEDQPTTFVASFSLVGAAGVFEPGVTAPIQSSEAMRYLGVMDRGATSFSPYRLWSSALGCPCGPGAMDLNVIGCAVEAITGVHSIPCGNLGTAILRNPMCPQTVELDSTL
jgi:hypothetical protein